MRLSREKVIHMKANIRGIFLLSRSFASKNSMLPLKLRKRVVFRGHLQPYALPRGNQRLFLLRRLRGKLLSLQRSRRGLLPAQLCARLDRVYGRLAGPGLFLLVCEGKGAGRPAALRRRIRRYAQYGVLIRHAVSGSPFMAESRDAGDRALGFTQISEADARDAGDRRSLCRPDETGDSVRNLVTRSLQRRNDAVENLQGTLDESTISPCVP